MKRVARAAGLLLAIAWSAPALAADPPASPREAARTAFQNAEHAGRDLRFQEALAAYEEAFTRDPTAPFSPAARARADDLRAHSEGAFAPLARLEAVRRDPQKNRDATNIAALERDAHTFPDGRVRSEALLVVAQAYAHILGEPVRAIAALEAVLRDPFSDRSTRALALSEVIALYRDRGDTAAALAAVTRESDLLPTLTREVRDEARRGKVAKACLALWVVLLLGAAWGAIRAALRLGDIRAIVPLVVRRGTLLFAFYVGAGGALFVRANGKEGDPLPFLGLGIGIALASILVRCWSLADRSPSAAKARLRALCGVLGVLAAAYLILWKSSPAYLTPLGL